MSPATTILTFANPGTALISTKAAEAKSGSDSFIVMLRFPIQYANPDIL